jgi:hypothetical protein
MGSLVMIRERTYVEKVDININGKLMRDLKSNPRQANIDGEIEFSLAEIFTAFALIIRAVLQNISHGREAQVSNKVQFSEG